MGPLARLDIAFQKTIMFINNNTIRIALLSMLFFFAALAYSISWYILDIFKDIACYNGNYAIELLFCGTYLGILGKHIIATMISASAILPFAGLVYLVHNQMENRSKKVLQSISESMPGIFRIIIFRTGLVLLLFSPFILFLVFGGDIIAKYITETGRLTIQKLFMVDLIIIPVSLAFGFIMMVLLEPVFQYVEYEVLVSGLRVRDAIRNSYRIAMNNKKETFISGFTFVAIWSALIFLKYLHMVNILLSVALLAAVFVESFLIFPVRAIFLYFLWKDLREENVEKNVAGVMPATKSYLNKMLMG
ncbi:MAG: hypothetical protein ACP5H8_02660 [Candidatus Micrarchaeia archaeon]